MLVYIIQLAECCGFGLKMQEDVWNKCFDLIKDQYDEQEIKCPKNKMKYKEEYQARKFVKITLSCIRIKVLLLCASKRRNEECF